MECRLVSTTPPPFQLHVSGDHMGEAGAGAALAGAVAGVLLPVAVVVPATAAAEMRLYVAGTTAAGRPVAGPVPGDAVQPRSTRRVSLSVLDNLGEQTTESPGSEPI